MPANDDLAVLAQRPRDRRRPPGEPAGQAIGDVSEDYDDILIDRRPSLSMLSVNALVAALEVLIITEPEPYSGRGVGKLLDTIDSIVVATRAVP